MWKRSLILILALLMLALCACGSGENAAAPETEAPETPAPTASPALGPDSFSTSASSDTTPVYWRLHRAGHTRLKSRH